jgi:hypothetical protein
LAKRIYVVIVNSPATITARRLASVVCVAVAALTFTAAEQPSASEWTAEGGGNGITIHSRTRAGSAIKEFRGIGVIDAPPAAVFAVVDDSEAYPSFMPYTAEARVLKRDKDTVINYQRLRVPLVSDRDYTLRSENARWNGPEGPIYRVRWAPANNVGPAPTPACCGLMCAKAVGCSSRRAAAGHARPTRSIPIAAARSRR